MISRDKVRGMFLGIGVGDALGMPVETWTPAQIRAKFPDGIRRYEAPSDDHKWFAGNSAGTWTDDTLLSLATARGLVEAKGLDLLAQSRAQVWAMREALKGAKEGGTTGGSGIPGWGYSTAEAVRRMANHWHPDSTAPRGEGTGHGNGVVMKIAPIAAWAVLPTVRHHKLDQQIVGFSAMTHYTIKSAVAAVVHVHAVMRCFDNTPLTYDVQQDLYKVIDDTFVALRDGSISVRHLNGGSVMEMIDQLDGVPETCHLDLEEVVGKFGGGSCNVAHSLPFTYAHWVRNYDSVQLLYDLVEAGGDTDSNASIAGAMLGALHGMSVFPDHLLTDLDRGDEIVAAANEFCDTFGID